jgi:integrase
MSRKEESSMNKYVFKSILAPYMDSFLQMKETMGFGQVKFRVIFKEFDKFFIENDVTEPCITQSLISRWNATRVNDSCRTLYDKYSVISQFSKYMCHLGYPCYVPRLPRRLFNNFIPYIFTHEQIAQILKTCDSLVMLNNNMESKLFALPALFRLLYSTGLRISEATSLKNEDVDFERRFIIIRKTKNQRQRLTPLNVTMIEVMLQYRNARQRLPLPNLDNPDNFFFVSPSGKPLNKGNAYGWFRKILKKCGIPHLGKNHGPRVHDLRHTCAVHSLMKQVKEGADIYCILPVISVFLGHKTIKGTELYIRLTQEMYPEIIKQEQSVTSFVFPSQPEIEPDYEN